MSPKRRALKRKAQHEDPRVSAAYDILKNVANTPKDECFTFGQHIATKLQKFDEKVRSVAMHVINNIIFDAEMGKYNNYFNNSYNHQTPSQAYQQYTTLSCAVPAPSPTYSVNSYQSNQSSDSSNDPQLYVAPSAHLTPQLEDNQVSPVQQYLHSFTDMN